MGQQAHRRGAAAVADLAIRAAQDRVDLGQGARQGQRPQTRLTGQGDACSAEQGQALARCQHSRIRQAQRHGQAARTGISQHIGAEHQIGRV